MQQKPSEFFLNATLTPQVVEAGDSVEFTVTLTVGKDFSAENTRILLDNPAYLGQDRPTRYYQEDGGYVEVFCSNADLAYTCLPWDMEINDFPTRDKRSFNGMGQRMLVLDFISGKSQAGDVICIKWGWTRNGFGIGCKTTTLALQPDFINTLHVRYFSDSSKGLPDLGRSFKGYDRPEPDVEIPLNFKVTPRQPEKIRLVRGLQESALLIQDRFSNVCPKAALSELIQTENEFTQNSLGVYVSEQTEIEVESNALPLKTTPSMKNVFEGMNIYWGDLHTHSSLSVDTIEREKQQMTPADNYRFGRDTARLDFMAVTDHQQPWDTERFKIGASPWKQQLSDEKEFDKPGRFLAFSGIEFRCHRGDTAVIFNEAMDYAGIDNPEMNDIGDFWNLMRGHDYITIPHYHNPGTLPADEWIDPADEGVETVQEIFSCHGAYDVEQTIEHLPAQIKERRPDRTGNWMLRRGLKYGTCCNSDGHKGNPGMNGLTAVYALELTKAAIFKAIRNRQTYGTTNARIKLLFTADGSLMGSTLPCAEKSSLHIQVAGEEPFKSVELIRNGELFKRFRPMTHAVETTLEVDTSVAAYYYVRAVQLDNETAWSSPIWFE